MRDKPEAYATKKAYSPVRLDEHNFKINGGVLEIPAENRFDHTNFKELKIEYSIDGGEIKTADSPVLMPHSKGVISIDDSWSDAKTVNIKFYTPYDNIMVDEYNIKIAECGYKLIAPSAHAPKISEDNDTLTVSGDDFDVILDKSAGLIKQASYKGDLLSLPAYPAFSCSHDRQMDFGQRNG
jgi:hypothetical protein